MPLRIVQVDAFTDKPFAGNPAAVCVLPEWRDETWMQLVAREMNLAETAFLVRQKDGFGLRWFTPAVEVDLCGHATLASAQVLWQDGHLPAGAEARFHTRSGLLTARQDGAWITMDFPAEPEVKAPLPEPLVHAFGAVPVYCGKNRVNYLVELDSEEWLREMVPDLSGFGSLDCQGVIVTARSAAPGIDFISRYFAPRAGIAEDPVTGSAHCCLGPYWQRRLGRAQLVGYQASARGGTVRVEVAGERVLLSGQAVTVMVGELV